MLKNEFILKKVLQKFCER